MRRRGTPNACCSSCGRLKQKLEELWNRVSGAIVRINNVSADGNNDFTIQGGDRISVTPITNGIEIASSADAVGVATINNEDPDSDGNFDIAAGSGIIVTPGTNEVEVKADTSVLMDLSSAQNVTGSKTFDGRVYSKTGFVVDNNLGGFVNFRNANSVPKSRIESDADGKVTIEPGMNSGINAAEIVNQRAYDPANTDDIATIGTLDAYTPMVRTTGTQRKSGSLIMTTADSFYLNTSTNYNHAMIKSTGQSMSLDFRRRNSDDSASDPSMSFGRWYSDGTSLYCGMTAYAPRTTIGDTSEVQRWGRITVKVQKNGGVSIYVSANKSDGTTVDKILATFDGTSWS